jgi:hypothetical protein
MDLRLQRSKLGQNDLVNLHPSIYHTPSVLRLAHQTAGPLEAEMAMSANGSTIVFSVSLADCAFPDFSLLDSGSHTLMPSLFTVLSA